MKKKIDSMQALRAWCCLSVFVYHCGFNIVTWAVSVFFVMSAFLLTVSSTERDTEFSLNPIKCLGYAWGKVKSLYPLYMITLLPILALNLYAGYKGAFGQTFAGIAKQFILSVFLVQSWSSNDCMAFNGVAWYLSTSFFLYFAFPYIHSVIRRYRRRSDAVVAMAILFCAEVVICALLPKIKNWFFASFSANDYSFEKWFTFIFPPFKLLDFALGCNLGWLFATRDKTDSKVTVELVDTLCISVYIISVIIFRLTENSASTEWFRCSLLFVPLSLILVYDFVLEKGLLPRIVTNKYTVMLGNISGFFYLIHQDIIRLFTMLWEYLALPFTNFKYIAAIFAFVATVVLSVLWIKLISRKKNPLKRGV